MSTDLGAAVFDFDRTMVCQESMAMFLQLIAGPGDYYVACTAAGALAVLASPGQRLNVFRSELLHRTLVGRTMAQAKRAADLLFERLVWHGEVMSEFDRHCDAGRRVLVATGSLSVYMPFILEKKGLISCELFATEMEVDGDIITGKMATPSCTWDEKARRVKAWLSGSEGEVWGYGNMPYDAAMLALTDHPAVVPVSRGLLWKRSTQGTSIQRS